MSSVEHQMSNVGCQKKKKKVENKKVSDATYITDVFFSINPEYVCEAKKQCSNIFCTFSNIQILFIGCISECSANYGGALPFYFVGFFTTFLWPFLQLIFSLA